MILFPALCKNHPKLEAMAVDESKPPRFRKAKAF